MYHYLGDAPPSAGKHAGLYVPVADFRAQMRALRHAHVRSLSPEEFEGGLAVNALHNAVWLTFDDGRLDNFAEGLPILQETGHRATFFVIVERSLAAEKGFIDVVMMKEMIAAGMSIGSHTLTHPHLSRLPAADLRREVVDSKHRLEDALGVEIISFCYPYGNLNEAVMDMVHEAGYRLAVSTIRDNRNGPDDRLRLRRAMVQPGRTGIRFRYLFSPIYHWVHARKNRSRWKKKMRKEASG